MKQGRRLGIPVLQQPLHPRLRHGQSRHHLRLLALLGLINVVLVVECQVAVSTVEPHRRTSDIDVPTTIGIRMSSGGRMTEHVSNQTADTMHACFDKLWNGVELMSDPIFTLRSSNMAGNWTSKIKYKWVVFSCHA